MLWLPRCLFSPHTRWASLIFLTGTWLLKLSPLSLMYSTVSYIIHFLEFAWFDGDDTLWSQFAFLFSAAKCFCIQNSSVKSCWSLKIDMYDTKKLVYDLSFFLLLDFSVSFDMLGNEFVIRSSKTFWLLGQALGNLPLS